MNNLFELYEKTSKKYLNNQYLDIFGLQEIERLVILVSFMIFKKNYESETDNRFIDNIWYLDDEGITILMMLAGAGNLEFVKFLVEEGANINTVGYHGDFALEIAAREGWQDIFEYLFPLTCEKLQQAALKQIRKGIKYRNKQKRRLSEILASASKHGDLEKIRIAIALGVDVNSQNLSEEVVFHPAGSHNQIKALQALLQ